DKVKSVAAPLAFGDYGLARVEGQQAQIRANFLAAVVAPVDGHLEIKLVIEMSVVLRKQVLERRNITDGVQYFATALMFARHSLLPLDRRVTRRNPRGFDRQEYITGLNRVQRVDSRKDAGLK